jgi:hypothetical protein
VRVLAAVGAADEVLAPAVRVRRASDVAAVHRMLLALPGHLAQVVRLVRDVHDDACVLFHPDRRMGGSVHYSYL